MHALLIPLVAPAVLTAMCSAPASGPDPAAERVLGQGGKGRDDCKSALCLTLAAPRTELRLAEPLTLLATLRNGSARSVEVATPLDPEYGTLSLSASKGELKPELYQPITRREGRGRPAHVLASGESIAGAFGVGVGAGGWLLGEVGRYRLVVEYALPGGERVRSNDVQVEVLPPRTAEEKRAVEIFMGNEPALMFQFQGGEHLAAGKQGLGEISRRYSDTYLAPYADLALGVSQSQSAFDPRTRTFRAPDCAVAAGHLQRAAAGVGDLLSAARATAALIACYKQLGRSDDAEAAAASFHKAHPEAASILGVRQVVDSALNKD